MIMDRSHSEPTRQTATATQQTHNGGVANNGPVTGAFGGGTNYNPVYTHPPDGLLDLGAAQARLEIVGQQLLESIDITNDLQQKLASALLRKNKYKAEKKKYKLDKESFKRQRDAVNAALKSTKRTLDVTQTKFSVHWQVTAKEIAAEAKGVSKTAVVLYQNRFQPLILDKNEKDSLYYFCRIWRENEKAKLRAANMEVASSGQATRSAMYSEPMETTTDALSSTSMCSAIHVKEPPSSVPLAGTKRTDGSTARLKSQFGAVPTGSLPNASTLIGNSSSQATRIHISAVLCDASGNPHATDQTAEGHYAAADSGLVAAAAQVSAASGPMTASVSSSRKRKRQQMETEAPETYPLSLESNTEKTTESGVDSEVGVEVNDDCANEKKHM